MKFLLTIPVVGLFFLVNASQKQNETSNTVIATNDTIHFEGENHFSNVRQLTFGGDNAEAYFSFDGKYIVVTVGHADIAKCKQHQPQLG